MAFNLIILIVGFSGIAAQVLVLRELLVSFYGNELTLGIILANWLASEALGVYLAGRLVDRVKNKINVFLCLQAVFLAAFPIAIYLCRVFKNLIGLPIGEALGLNVIFLASFIIILPLGFAHAGLFSAGCKISLKQNKEAAVSIGNVYTWETLGTILGGLALTFLFIPHLDSFQIVFIILAVNFAACLILSRKYYMFIIFAALAAFGANLNQIQSSSIKKQWRGTGLLDYRNSIYGNIAVAKKLEQYTFFYNGIPVIFSPYPDITFTEEFGSLPMSFHPKPKEILIISGGAGGLINQILKFSPQKIDYAELDPLLIKMLKNYPTDITAKELSDKRVRVVNSDGRLFLRTGAQNYDLILNGISKPADLSTNRFFTREFFALAKNKLKPGGILAFCLPGSLAYLSNELRDINACVINALKKSFAYVRVIPGDYNLILASDAGGLLKAGPDLIRQRLEENNIKSNILIRQYLDYRLSRKWEDWFKISSAGATKKINRDFMPYAVFETMVLWNKQFFPRSSRFFETLAGLSLKWIAIIIAALTAALFFAIKRGSMPARSSVPYAIFTTGFFGMLSNLILILGFQVIFGYLYQMIGVLISVFMAGIAVGSVIITSRLGKISNLFKLFIGLEAGMIIFALSLGCLLAGLSPALLAWPPVFAVLLFIPGFLLGVQFPLANKIYLGRKQGIGETAGLLYGSDLLGSWLAGILGGILLLPVLGALGCCLVIAMLKFSSLFLINAERKRII